MKMKNFMKDILFTRILCVKSINIKSCVSKRESRREYFKAREMFLFEEHRALHGAKRVINICFGTIKTLRGMCDAK